MNTSSQSGTTFRPRAGSRWCYLKHNFVEWRRRLRSRSELMNLGDGSLRDIGLSRGEAKTEASKPFWLA
jgi:uncharacterized protein YjiS (DUF1127 family)